MNATRPAPHAARTLPSLFVLGAAVLVLVACTPGGLPTLRTQRIDVQSVGFDGLALRVALTATNEHHGETLMIDGLRVNVFVNGQDLGVVEVNQAWDLPPGQPVGIETMVTVPLPNLPELALNAAAGPVPYRLVGTAHVANVGWEVSFTYDDYIPQEQLVGAAARTLPFGIPLP